jgi:hypothetical protein
MTKPPVNTRGQSTIEAVALTSLGVILFAAALYTVSLSVARLWLEHTVYNSLICELAAIRDCKEKFLHKSKWLSWGEIQKFELSTSRHADDYKSAEAHLVWQHNWGGATWDSTKQVVLQMSLREKHLAGSRLSHF